jgi:hypothetical protein
MKVAAWKVVLVESESVAEAQADLHLPTQRKSHWRERLRKKRCLAHRKFPAQECWRASVKGWYRPDE